VKNSQKVLLIGIDAATWKLTMPLVKAGKLPNIKKLMLSGAYGNLTTFDPTSSPIIWTSIATGKVKEKHGIDGFVRQINGKEIPLTSNVRKAKAIWNILSDNGISVSVIGWWNSWPAEQVNGTIVSSYIQPETIHTKGPKGYIYQDIPQQTYPPELMSELWPLIQSGEENGQKIFHQIFNQIEENILNPIQKSALENIKFVCIRDETFSQIGLYLQKQYTPEFLAVYFGGIDNISHRLWKYTQPNALNFKVSEKEQEIFGGVIINYYQYIDKTIGKFVDSSDKNTMIIIVSDHGIHPAKNHKHRTFSDLTGSHRGDDPGIFIISGQNTRTFRQRTPFNNFQNVMRQFLEKYTERRFWLFDDAEWFRCIQLYKGHEQFVTQHRHLRKRRAVGFVGATLSKLGLLKQVSVFDIAPTILYVFDLPVAQDMDGRVITEAFTPEFLESNPVNYIESYEDAEDGVDDRPIESAMDEEIKERLRGLGYI